ncbi:PIR Superfamily Protein [Plasmodium ovale curtisi]|uniref:PIR Superfamily Protein n=1 Tax=Plasmodium ovale curtisi TaxID=864141 RepID=A0A1A8WQ96_PLAOA|nr:PIR Superfamily Protein [Plasmodium ovale curtisi]
MPDENDLDSLPSNIIYRKLDNALLLKGHFDECEHKLPQELKEYDGFDDFCRILAYNLDQVKTEETYTNLRTESCDALNIWVYDRLFSETKRDKPYEWSTFPFEQFLSIWNKLYGNDRCRFSLEKCTVENFKKVKEIFDLTINYNSIKQKINLSSGTCSVHYNSYINKIVNTYKSLMSNCEQATEPHCKFVQYIKSSYDENDILNLQCIITSGDSANRVTEQRLDDQPGYADNVTGTSNSSVAMGICFSVLGIIFICFALYRFTPFGSLFKVFLIKNKIIGHNINEEETNQFFEHTHVPADIVNMYGSRHIGYNAA